MQTSHVPSLFIEPEVHELLVRFWHVNDHNSLVGGDPKEL